MIVPDDTFRSVLKFGGSCLKSSQDISAIAERISEIDHYPVVVVSAFFGVTDRLFDAIHEAKEGRLVIWPAYWTHFHKSQVSKTTTKYILTGWYRFVPNI